MKRYRTAAVVALLLSSPAPFEGATARRTRPDDYDRRQAHADQAEAAKRRTARNRNPAKRRILAKRSA